MTPTAAASRQSRWAEDVSYRRHYGPLCATAPPTAAATAATAATAASVTVCTHTLTHTPDCALPHAFSYHYGHAPPLPPRVRARARTHRPAWVSTQQASAARATANGHIRLVGQHLTLSINALGWGLGAGGQVVFELGCTHLLRVWVAPRAGPLPRASKTSG